MEEMSGLFGATYLRISRDKGENEDTLQNHREMMQRFCEKHGYRFEVYEEIVSGGQQGLESRSELQKLIDNIEHYQAIFAVSLDRLSRNGLVSQQIRQLCIDHDIIIITPSKMYDLANSQEDRLMYDVGSLFSTMEYEMIGHRNKANKMERARRGEYVGGLPAYGYRRNRKTRRLVIYEPEAQVVRYIFKLHREGYSHRKIANILNSDRYKPRTASAFRPPTIRKILQNPVYKGTVVFQDRKRVKENGKYRYKVLETIITEGAHPAIITPEEWEQAQRKLAERKKESRLTREKPASQSESTMLKDLLFCGLCGRKMVTRRERNGAFTIRACNYWLPNNSRKCNNQGMRLKFLEEEVMLKIQSHKEGFIAHLQQETDIALKALQERLALIETRLLENEQQQQKVLDMALIELVPLDKFKAKSSALEAQHQKLMGEKEKILQQIRKLEAASPFDRTTPIIRLFEELPALPAEEQNRILKQFVKRIEFTRMMPVEIGKKSTMNEERQAYPFTFTIEYL